MTIGNFDSEEMKIQQGTTLKDLLHMLVKTNHIENNILTIDHYDSGDFCSKQSSGSDKFC